MIGVFFGGRSCEHDISIITGLQAMSACSQKCVPVYVDGEGRFWTGSGFDSVSAVKNFRFKGKLVHLRPSSRYLFCNNRKLCKIDAALLCMHGMLGEDGSLQGLLEMCGIPYTGSNVSGSAVGMNKLLSKTVFERAGMNVLPYVALRRTEYQADAATALTEFKDKIGFPAIVKPCNLGSSIGISVASNMTELYKSIRVAFEWDDTIIIERALEDFKEVNCAVLGDSCDAGSVVTSDTEQPVGWKNFLTFSDKYSGSVKTQRHKIPAEIGEDNNERVKELAARAFCAVGCSGVARVDFLVKDDEIYVNEINTIPGSLSCALFKSGMRFSELIDKLLDIAVKKQERVESLKRVYTPLEPIIGK